MLSDKDKKALQCTTSSHTDEEYAALKERYDMMRQLIENLRDDLDIPSNETGLRYRVGILIDDNAALEAQLEQANIAVEEYQDWLKKAEAQVQRLTEALETIAGNGLTLDKRKYDADDAVLMRKCARFALKEKKDA